MRDPIILQTIPIRLAETDRDIQRCFQVLHELRPHLQPDDFATTVRRQQREGYFLVLLEAGGEVAAVAGYRLGENLARGKFLYVDDFATLATVRRQGHGQKLFDWLVNGPELPAAGNCTWIPAYNGPRRIGFTKSRKWPLPAGITR